MNLWRLFPARFRVWRAQRIADRWYAKSGSNVVSLRKSESLTELERSLICDAWEKGYELGKKSGRDKSGDL